MILYEKIAGNIVRQRKIEPDLLNASRRNRYDIDNWRLESKIDQLIETCNRAANVIPLTTRASPSANLENQTDHMQLAPVTEGGLDMAQIDRRVIINGQLRRIRANDEQSYADKIIQIATDNSEQVERHDFKTYALRWFETFSKPSVETATALTYERQLTNVWIPAFDGLALEEITTAHIQTALNEMGDVAKETKIKAKNVLSMIFEHALEEGLVQRNFVKSKNLKIKGRKARETEPYSVEQMQYLASHVGDVKNPTDRAYLALHAFHPLRPEEVFGLKHSDIDWEHGKITVRRAVTYPDRNQPTIKATKTDASERIIDLVAQIKKFVPDGEADDFILGGKIPLTYQQIRLMRKRIEKDTGFNEPIVPRRFRTTVLADLYDATKDIKQTQAAAGHTTAAMTLKHYVKGRGGTTNTAAPVANLYGIA